MSNCNKVVNISWLKTFISGVKNSDGTDYSISSSYLDSYCPTYEELTRANDPIVPKRTSGSSGPYDDVDGILVNSKCYGTNDDYASNQLVNIKDITVGYTTSKSFSIAASPSTGIDCCGGSSNLSFTWTLTRSTKVVADTCEDSGSTTTADVNETRSDKIASWKTNIGNISNQVLTMPKNTSSAATVTATVSAYTSSFRGSSSGISATTSVVQNKLTGDWTYNYSDWVERKDFYATVTTVGLKAYGDGNSYFPCTGGSATSNAYSKAKKRDHYYWTDKCGVDYPSRTSAVTDSNYSGDVYYSATSITFDAVTDKSAAVSTAKTLSWAGTIASGISDVSYTQKCSKTESCPRNDDYGSASVTVNDVSCSAGSVSLSTSSMPKSSYTQNYDDFNRCYSSVTTSTVAATGSANVTRNTGAARQLTGSASASPGGTITYTINQKGGCTNCESYTSYTNANVTATTTVPCTGGTVESLSGTVTYTAYTVTPDGEGCSTSPSESSYTAETGELTIPGSTGESQTSYTGTKNRINYTVNYEPCTCDTTYTFASEVTITGLALPCGGGEILIGNNGDTANPQVLVPYTATCGSSTEELTLPISVWAYVTPYDFDHDAPGSEQRTGSVSAEYTGPDENVHGVTINWEGTQSNCTIQICECEDLDIKGTKQ